MPLGVWVTRLPPGAAGVPGSVRGGALLGAVYFGLTFYWVPVALVVADPGFGSAAFAVTAFALIVVGLAGLTAVSVRLLHHAVHALGAPLWLALAVTWTALEWARAHLPDSLALPWLGLGTSLTAYPELVGVAEIVGARGVTFWLATVNGLLATLWLRRFAGGEGGRRVDGVRVGGRSVGRGRAARVAATAVVIGAPATWGVWRASTLETRPVADVAVVQPNVAGRAKVPAEPTPQPDPTDLLPDPARVISPSPALVVLPELFVRAVPGSPEASRAVDALRTYSERVGAPVLFGALGGADGVGGAEGRDLYNSAFLVTPAGLADFRYDKHRLVPVVERVPFVLQGAGDGLDGPGVSGAGGYGVGTGWPLAEVDGVGYGVLICYESSYPETARALRRAGADVLVNVTNDAWFGGEPWYARTTALWQHPAHLVMRAIEGRVGVVRSANTGISFFVDPVGRRHEMTELFSEDARRHRVRTADVTTAYVRFGDVVGNASALVAFGLLLLLMWAPSLDPPGPRV